MKNLYHSCPISGEPVIDVILKMGDTIEYVCPTCGRCRITCGTIEQLKSEPRWERWAKLEEAVAIGHKCKAIPFLTLDSSLPLHSFKAGVDP